MQKDFFSRLLRDEQGTSAVEYAIICAAIMLAIVGAAQAVADATIGMWNDVNEKTTAAMSGDTA